MERAEGPEGESPARVLQVESAAEALSMVESELMAAQERALDFEVVSEGAFHASLQGRLVLAGGDALSMEASGTFGADTVRLRVRGEEGRMMWGNSSTTEEAELPPDLRGSVVLGLVRMGVLHNLARLVSGAPPERTDGSVGLWVETEEARWVSARTEDGARGIHFGIVVSGSRTAEATVWLDAGGHLVEREQVVRFPGGEMRVVERYASRDSF
jgi:hypothetical protein